MKVRDTVGAGDTFSAGLIDAALHDSALLEVLDEKLCTDSGATPPLRLQSRCPTWGRSARTAKS